MFLGTAFEVEEPLPNVEQRYKCTEKKGDARFIWWIVKVRKKSYGPKSTEQFQSCGKSICCTHSIK